LIVSRYYDQIKKKEFAITATGTIIGENLILTSMQNFYAKEFNLAIPAKI
jgi:hypothetical protein